MRRRRRRREDIYSTNYDRLSSYPSYKSVASKDAQKSQVLKPGMIVKIRVTGVDDDGKPSGQYMGYNVVVEDLDVDPGIELKVRIERVVGNTAYARPVE